MNEVDPSEDPGGLLRPDDWEDPIRIPEVGPVARVLVAFDGSHAAERGLAWAERLVAPSGGEVVVLVSYQPPLTKKGRGSTYVDAVRVALADEARELAEEAVSLLLSRGAAARAVVVRGEPADAIRQVAADDDADIVVVGRHGLASELRGLPGAMERLRDSVSGGVAERAVRHLDVPVLVVD